MGIKESGCLVGIQIISEPSVVTEMKTSQVDKAGFPRDDEGPLRLFLRSRKALLI